METSARPAPPLTAVPGAPIPEPAVPPELIPNLDELVIEDITPVDNIHIEKQQRLLAQALYDGQDLWARGRLFQVFANVGLFFAYKQEPLVPDLMLLVDARVGDDLDLRENRSYFLWIIGKPPDVVIEIVSDRRGREADFKLDQYARIGVPYYVIYDPLDRLHHGLLRGFELRGGVYVPLAEVRFPRVGLALDFWQGTYEESSRRWLRWYDLDGRLIPIGPERFEQERQRAEQERQRAERLEARLKSLGIDPQS